MADADHNGLLPDAPDPSRIAPYALRGLAGLLLFLGDRGDAPTDFDDAVKRWRALPDRKNGKQAEKLGLKNLSRLDETVQTACALGASLPALTRADERRRATLALLRLLARLDLVRSRKGGLPDPGEPIPLVSDEAGRVHARAIELLVRAMINESYADQDLLLERVRAWQSKVAEKWMNVADESDVLSGFDLKDLAALFVHTSEFPNRYAGFYSNTPFLRLNGTDQRKTMELFLEDACEIRNRIAHHKPLTGNQTALLNLYWDDVAIPMAEAYGRGTKAAVDPNPFMQSGASLDAWTTQLQRHIARTERDSVFLRETASATKADTGAIRSGVDALGRHARLTLSCIAVLIAGVGIVAWQTEGISPKLASIQGSMKLESSSDPRKELMNRGVPWSAENLLKAMEAGDIPTVKLFLAGGMDPSVPYEGCDVFWYAIARGMAKAGEQIDLFARADYKFNDPVRCEPSGSSNYSNPPLATAILYRNGPVTEALLSHGTRVTSAMVAMLSQLPVMRSDYAEKFGPMLRERLANQGAQLPPGDALRLRGLPATPEGIVQSVRLGDTEALHLYEALHTPIDQDATFLALASAEGDNAFPEMLGVLKRMGLDIAARRKTQDYQNSKPQSLLTHAIRLREDAATRTLLNAGMPVTQEEIDGLQLPYIRDFSSRENRPDFPGRWQTELLQRRSPTTTASATPARDDPAPSRAINAGAPLSITALQTRMRANLRTSPSASASLAATIDVAAPVSLVTPCSTGQAWCQVRAADGRQGWISAELLEPGSGPGPIRGFVGIGRDTGWVTIGARSFRLIGLNGIGGMERQALDEALRDRRMQAECSVDDGAYSCRAGTMDLGGMIVAAGMARAADGRFVAEQRIAQQAHRGIWAK